MTEEERARAYRERPRMQTIQQLAAQEAKRMAKQADNTPPATPGLEKASGALGSDEVQEQVDAEQEQGYWGHKVDPTPNSAYTVAGVVAGEPTPETDADLAVEADKAAGLGLGPKPEGDASNAPTPVDNPPAPAPAPAPKKD